jgi:hypothetical protein
MSRILLALVVFAGGAAAGAFLRPLPAAAVPSGDHNERTARALEKLAEQLTELRRGAERRAESSADPSERTARALEKTAEQVSELRRAAERRVEVACTCDCRR